jgi:predicted permease
MAVVAIVLLIACANIANLLLARGTARRHELSVRRALGASRGRLLRQLLTESLLLSGIGALFGIVFARWGSQLLLVLLSSTGDEVFIDLGFDWTVFAFTMGVTVATALLFGIAPAWRAGEADPMEAITAQGRGIAGMPRTGLANGLVIGQVALSVVLVVSAGLFVRTFLSLATLDPGFERDRALVVHVDTQPARIDPANRRHTFNEVLQAVQGVPGVTSAALSVVTPVSRQRWNVGVEVPGSPIPPGPQNAVNLNWVTPGFFATYGTAMIAGRDFDDHDVANAQPVVIVNEAFVRKYFPAGDNPIGKTLTMYTGGGPSPPKEIIGVAVDAAYRSLRTASQPGMYGPLAQLEENMSAMNLTVRAAGGSPSLLTRSVAAAATSVGNDLALTFRPLSDFLEASLVQERVVALIAGFFGGLALLLAGLGLYGVTSYAVSRRRSEIGVRMALGAEPANVVWLVLARVFWLVGAGTVIGAVVSLWAGRFVTTLLFGLEPNDIATLAGAIGVLALVGGLAGWIPAQRAARIDPADVLRQT